MCSLQIHEIYPTLMGNWRGNSTKWRRGENSCNRITQFRMFLATRNDMNLISEKNFNFNEVFPNWICNFVLPFVNSYRGTLIRLMIIMMLSNRKWFPLEDLVRSSGRLVVIWVSEWSEGFHGWNMLEVKRDQFEFPSRMTERSSVGESLMYLQKPIRVQGWIAS